MDIDKLKRMMWLRKLYLKAVLPLEYPMILNIEPTNRCNLSCNFCPRKISKRPVVDLDWNTFLKIANELKKEGPILRIFLQKDGEPLLYPRIVDMVQALVSVNAAKRIGIISNGTLLTPKLFKELAEAGLHDLIISIDAVDANEYKELKGADFYGKVVENIELAMSYKKKNGLKTPLIKARMVARKGCDSKINEFTKFWKNRVDMVDITPFHTWIGAVEDERCYSTTKRYPCPLLWYTGIINSDGTVSPCCIDYNCDGVLDRIKSGFKAIWNGKAINKLRKIHLNEDYEKSGICEKCEYWQIKEDIGKWLKRKYKVGL